MNAKNKMTKTSKLQIIIIRTSIIAWLILNTIYSQFAITSQLADDMQYLLSSEPSIDYEDPRLKRILDQYQYKIFKIYKTFIEFDKSNKSQADVMKAKNELLDYWLITPDSERYHDWNRQDVIDIFCMFLTDEDATDLLDDLPDGEYNVALPLWLVLKYPTILNHNYGRWGPSVNSNLSIDDLDALNKLTTSLFDATDGYWRYAQGTMYRYYFAHRRCMMEQMSFAPDIFLAKRGYSLLELGNETEKYFKQLELWSYQGLWNTLKYKKILQYFPQASDSLVHYYSNNYGLKKYAPHAKLILAQYIDAEVSYIQLVSRIEIDYYKLIEQIKSHEGNLDELKKITQKFNKREKGYLLFYFVVQNFNIKFIQWLIDNGADMNSSPFDETPLMASVQNPKIMKLLLDSHANVLAKNRFGKNVLFYAVQFGSKEAVEILLDTNGRLVNSKIYNKQTIEDIYKLDEKFVGIYVHPTIVADFTPLVYAKRYASQEVIDLLIKHGAIDGTADHNVIIEWIKQGPMDL